MSVLTSTGSKIWEFQKLLLGFLSMQSTWGSTQNPGSWGIKIKLATTLSEWNAIHFWESIAIPLKFLKDTKAIFILKLEKETPRGKVTSHTPVVEILSWFSWFQHPYSVHSIESDDESVGFRVTIKRKKIWSDWKGLNVFYYF